MTYRSTRQLVDDLGRNDRLIVVDQPVDPHLELAEIHRRVYRSRGPALLFTNVTGCQFPVATNLFGTIERARFIFRDTIEAVKLAVRWKAKPAEAWRTPHKLLSAPLIAWRMRPRRVSQSAVTDNSCRLSNLPQIVCWPQDGGPFITLPQVMSRLPNGGLSDVNLGMYRVQLAGNDYQSDRECGLHYQIHRGIGVHHAAAIELGQSLPVTVTVGGTPAMTLAAVMPLPEGMSELTFAGALAGHRIPIHQSAGLAPIYADADFCIQGEVLPGNLKPEGPFGDHLGYYARVHDFPVLQVKRVTYRSGAVWPMTVVGRPPQEDTTFGELIHEITGPMIPVVLPGVRQVNAVDAAGVHPLLLAIGSERYTPYANTERPQELLTQANAILGQGQLSLAKYLWIVGGEASTTLDANDLQSFFRYALQRVDWMRDLHFITCTTMDTLDYSGNEINQGSKLVIAATGRARRQLSSEIDGSLRIPDSWSAPRLCMPGVLAVQTDSYVGQISRQRLEATCDTLAADAWIEQFPLIVVCDDTNFTASSLENFVWTTFTRSNPAIDVYGIGAIQQDKHFGCRGSLVIDARVKPHHAPGLKEDPHIVRKVDALAARGGALGQYL